MSVYSSAFILCLSLALSAYLADSFLLTRKVEALRLWAMYGSIGGMCMRDCVHRTLLNQTLALSRSISSFRLDIGASLP